MTDSFDQELRDAFAADEQDLTGWEFSPAMQQEVMRRIEVEKPANEVRRRNPYFRRSVVWAAAAAATLFIAVNLGKGTFMPMAGSQKPSATSAPSASPAPNGAAEVQKSTASAVPVPAPQTSANSVAGAASDTAQPATATAAPADRETGARKMAVQPVQLVLALPSTASTFAAPAAPRFLGVAVASDLHLAYAPATGQTLELNNRGLAAFDANAQPVWQQPLSGLDSASLLAVAPDGQSAVTAGQRLYRLAANGQVSSQIDLAAPAQALAWSADGRLAVLCGTKLTVYRSGDVAYELTADAGASLAFAPDGRLAVLYGGVLHVYGADGARLVESSVPTKNGPIGFIAGGNVLLASSKVVWSVNPSDGRTLWQAQYDGAEGLGKVVASPDGTRIAIFTAASSTPGLWVLDQNGTERQAETLPALPDDAVFADNGQLLFTTGGTLQHHPVTP